MARESGRTSRACMRMEQLRLAKKLIFNRVRWGQQFFLLTDLDGTLVPAKYDGPPAKLKASTRQDLADLAALRQTFAGVVSERELGDIAKLFSGMNVHLCAGMGLEYSQAAGIPMRIELNQHAALLDQIHAELKKLKPKVKGMKVERLGRFIHVAGLSRDSAKQAVYGMIGARRPLLRIAEGKSTLEIIQETGHDKGTAASTALRKVGFVLQSDTCIYIGDDQPDEAVFKIVNAFGITIRVGKSENSLAKYWAKDINEVLKFIGEIVEVRTEGVRERGYTGGARMF